METQHTKGEWQIQKGLSRTKVVCMFKNDKGLEDYRLYADLCHHLSVPLHEQQANARLIAAAPDMLDVLIQLVNNYEEQEGIHANNEEVISRAKQVIAKATSIDEKG